MPSTLNISLLQTDLVWEDKAANLQNFENMLDRVPDDVQIVVLPEMFPTGYAMNAKLAEKMDGPTVNWMKNQAMKRKKILTGSMIIEASGKVYNRMFWMLPNGAVHYYDKRHLFAYAGEDKVFTPGNKRLIVQVNGWKICLMVCYDLRFPIWSRQQEPNYDLLIYVASWPDSRILHWDTLLRARAIENQAYVVGVNRVGNDGHDFYHSGHSQVIDPMGRILEDAGEEGNQIVTCKLDKNMVEQTRKHFPFQEDADDFKIL